MSFEDESERRRKADDPRSGDASMQPKPRKKKRGDTPELGQALRSVYDRAMNEPIPPEMLDLLGKLD